VIPKAVSLESVYPGLRPFEPPDAGYFFGRDRQADELPVNLGDHRFVHVKDHAPDRTVDVSYLVYRELLLPFGEWAPAVRSTRIRYTAARGLPKEKGEFH
jgi:hypothetical protein